MAKTGVFVYGIVPADVEPTSDARGLGEPAGCVTAVSQGDVAALVSEVSLDRPLGRPAELRTYQQLLDGTAEVAPVLPVRFGAVLTDTDAVAELLETYHDDFRSALDQLEGRVEYSLRARYVEDAVLTEVVTENPQARQLLEQIRGMDEDASANLRIRLGELVYQGIEAKRAADSRRLAEAVAGYCEQVVDRPATHEEDAANLAMLVRTDRRDEFEEAMTELADQWADRVNIRLLGPLAPYDFVAPLEVGS